MPWSLEHLAKHYFHIFNPPLMPFQNNKINKNNIQNERHLSPEDVLRKAPEEVISPRDTKSPVRRESFNPTGKDIYRSIRKDIYSLNEKRQLYPYWERHL